MVDNAVLLLTVMGFYNLVLFALNLLPLPPLDGSRIVANFSQTYRRLTSDPTMQGIFLACTFGVFIAGGPYFSRFAGEVMQWYLAFFRPLIRQPGLPGRRFDCAGVRPARGTAS